MVGGIDIVLVDLVQHCAIADFQQPSGRLAVPASFFERSRNRVPFSF